MRKSLFLAALFCIILCNAEAKEPTSYNYQRGLEAMSDGETKKAIDLFNRDFTDAHDALADITATKECFFELKHRGII